MTLGGSLALVSHKSSLHTVKRNIRDEGRGWGVGATRQEASRIEPDAAPGTPGTIAQQEQNALLSRTTIPNASSEQLHGR